MHIELTVNGQSHSLEVEDNTLLVDIVRQHLGLTGTHVGCDTSQCGACTVHMDGRAVKACTIIAGQAHGSEITTIEGIAESELGRRVQDAFIETSAAQCGYCAAGLVVATTALLSQDASPDEESVKQALSPHLCRCGSHPRIMRAVGRASRK